MVGIERNVDERGFESLSVVVTELNQRRLGSTRSQAGFEAAIVNLVERFQRLKYQTSVQIVVPARHNDTCQSRTN